MDKGVKYKELWDIPTEEKTAIFNEYNSGKLKRDIQKDHNIAMKTLIQILRIMDKEYKKTERRE